MSSSLAFEDELQRLSPSNDAQRSLQSRAIAAFTEGAQNPFAGLLAISSSILRGALLPLTGWRSRLHGLSCFRLSRASGVQPLAQSPDSF